MILLLISNHKFEITILNTILIKNMLSYIKKFRLSISIAYRINSYFILNNVYIDKYTIALEIKLNLLVFNNL